MSQRAHAVLSASGAHKWLNCPPSARLEEQFPDSTSVYAAEGTLAHKVAELHLRKHFIEAIGPQKFRNALKKLKGEELFQEEMLTHAETYLDFIREVAHKYAAAPYVGCEARLDFSHIVPDGFGTGDCIVISGGDLHVIDYKYGKGVPVEAEGNPQIRLYALGALNKYALLYDVRDIYMTIVQPRLNSISTAHMSAEELTAWGESIRPVAELAHEGKGDFCAGEWCRFCRAKAQCRARSDGYTALEAFGGAKPPLLTDAEVGDILRRAKDLAAWVSDLEEYALSALLAGGEIPGWKAVEGRSVRQFKDTDATFNALIAAGYNEALLYERKPITLTAVEKLLGKATFGEVCGEYVVKPPGKPALAAETDRREAITFKTTAAEAFGTTNKKET